MILLVEVYSSLFSPREAAGSRRYLPEVHSSYSGLIICPELVEYIIILFVLLCSRIIPLPPYPVVSEAVVWCSVFILFIFFCILSLIRRSLAVFSLMLSMRSVRNSFLPLFSSSLEAASARITALEYNLLTVH